MGNKFLVFFLSAALLNSVYSQSAFEIGIIAGTELNFASSFNEENVKDYEAIPGFNIGVRLRHNFGIFSLIGGVEYGRLNFIKHGHPDTLFFGPWQEQTSLIAHQFRLPILFQVNVGKKRSQFFANIGPCFLFTSSGVNDRNLILYPDSVSFSSETYPKDIVQTCNMGLMTGAGYSFKLKDWLRLYSEVRFIIPMIANPGYTTDLNNTTRTLNLSWQFGVSFTGLPKPK